jgi:hypothetical protein
MMSDGRTQTYRVLLPRIAAFLGWLGALTLCASSCSEPGEPVADGSNTNWLRQCKESAECDAAVSCTCGVCSKRCKATLECEDLAGARCVGEADVAWQSTCDAAPEQASGLCLPGCEAGTCQPGQACVSGACTFVTPPDTPLCAAAGMAEPDARRRADELLAAMQARRVSGGVTCGGDAPSEPASRLRVDGRVTCAAVVHAADMNVSRVPSLIDSEGRNTADRLNAANYTPTFWAEAFAISDESAEAAVDIMLGDRESCRGITSPRAREAGVAAVDDVWVIVLGAE